MRYGVAIFSSLYSIFYSYKVNRPNLGHFKQKHKLLSSEIAYNIALYVELYFGRLLMKMLMIMLWFASQHK